MLPPESGLYGERVRLRPQELEDAAQFAEWFSNPDLMQWLAVPPFQMSLAALTPCMLVFCGIFTHAYVLHCTDFSNQPL